MIGTSDQAWTADDVRYRLIEAAATLRRLPLPPRSLPAEVRAAWPDVVTSTLEAYGYAAPRRGRPPAPEPQAIRRLDETLGWLLWLDEEARRLVWARACGITWRRIEDRDGRCERTLRTRMAEAIALIQRRLNTENKKTLAGVAGKRVVSAPMLG
jgi:hypothetical protein